MLRDFLAGHRERILAEARSCFARRTGPLASDSNFTHGLPIFLDQLREALRKTSCGESVDRAAIQLSGREHGDELFRQGASVAQVVHDYGDIGQAIRSLAEAEHTIIAVDETHTLGLCIDVAIAAAVTAYGRSRDQATAEQGSRRLGIVAHDMRSELNDAIMAFASIRKGVSSPGGSTSAILDRSLLRLSAIVDCSLADVRLNMGTQNSERVPLWEVIEEVEIGASMIGRMSGVHFAVKPVDETVVVQADRQILAAAVANLLQNAFKFTRPGHTVRLNASSTPRRVLIEVEDACGGLSPEDTVRLLRPDLKTDLNRARSAFGLPVCSRAVQAIGGNLRVDGVPGNGCLFTIELPNQAPASPPVRARERGRPEVPAQPTRARGR